MSKISEALFSKATRAILSNVFARPDGVHLRALMSHTGLGSASAQRELGKLTEAGLLTRQELGKVILYKPNTNSPIYPELSAIIRKTEGVEQVLKEMLLPFESRIESAFIYGSVAKNEDTAFSDIDLFVLADEIGSADLYPKLVEAEEKLGRKIGLTVYRPMEYRRKLEGRNHFLVSVMDGPKIQLIGKPD
ncbi:nucleotidyltransferase domain-containing protein [Collimonas sp.]|jgi:predicted nucleotidyltransferase|uniref:nucleotidyltransferase family protein n=1 Tax=Collimonas sp. TaxID=1963772 RepID=UPI002C1E3CDE|nr:nucleotidyltransferase domain-containing protein [Collimonas sp.]HWW08571.1 nucleotidyltransferase domain-containing protein [Collimonas sp.]